MSQSKTSQYLRQLPPLATVVLLTLTILACGFIGSGGQPASGQIVFSTRLPTLTRTPLPTLTPTPNSVALVAAAQATSPLAPQQTENGAEPLSPSPITVNEANVTTVINGEGVAADHSAGATGEQPVENDSSSAVVEEAINSVDALTATPTTLSTETPTSTSTPTATETPLPTDTPTTTPTLSPEWVFTGVRLDQSRRNPLLYGDLVNNTSAPQNLALISGTFYDAQGQPITEAGTFDYWIIETIRPGGRVPFELTIFGPQRVANYDLTVDAGPGNNNEIPREDFEFLDVNQSSETGEYCVTGRVRNPGDSLQSYLATAIILYDGQDNVINFSDDYQDSPTGLVGDQTLDFYLCVDPLGQAVSRYELRAWGL